MKLSVVMKPLHDYNVGMVQDWKGAKNPRWNGGKRTLTNGYIMVKADPTKHSVTKDGYILEHRKIMEDLLGRKLNRVEVVHHLNHIPSDNRPENLELISSHSEHIKREHNHIINYKKPKIFTSCKRCGRTDVKNDSKDLCHNCYQWLWKRGLLSN